jgi:hypothetical protein
MPRITTSTAAATRSTSPATIFDRLAGHFAREAVFRYIDNVPPGADFSPNGCSMRATSS